MSKNLIPNEITITQERRFCKVNGEICYFHCWEHYSQPIEASPMCGGHPGGTVSFVRGVVEFPDGKIGTVFPNNIQFTDSEHTFLEAHNEAYKLWENAKKEEEND